MSNPCSENVSKRSLGEKDKYFKLSDEDFKVILTEGEKLNDYHMYKFRELLFINSKSTMKMENTLLVHLLNQITPISIDQKHIQILFSGADENSYHWICTYYDSKQLFVYNSLNLKYLNEDQTNFLKRLLPFNTKIVFPTVQQQPNTKDCGLFAIAFAISVFFNIKPETVTYDHSKMRQHLYSMFQNNCLLHFPTLPGSKSITFNLNSISSNMQELQNLKIQENNDKKLIRAAKDRDRKRKARLEETNEQKLCRQEKDRNRKRELKLQKTELKKQERLQKNLISKNKQLLLETDAEKQKRQQSNLLCKKKKLSLETEIEKQEKRKRDLLSKKKKLSLETEIEKQERQERNLLCKKKKLSLETETEKQERQKSNLLCKQKKLSLETESEKQERQGRDLLLKKKKMSPKKNNDKIDLTGIAISSITEIDETKITENYLGSMNVKCDDCESLNFLDAMPKDKQFSICCHKGKVKLEELKPYPSFLKDLVCDGISSKSKNFKENIRSYNNALAFASMGAKLEIPKGRGPFVFRIHGQVYHNTYELHPNNDDKRKYSQLYILDTNEAVQERLNNECNKKCIQSLMTELDILLRDINPYAEAFKMMREVELEEEKQARLLNKPIRDIKMWIKRDRLLDQNTFNVPSCNEVAVVFVSEDGEPPIERDICIHPKGTKSIPISSLSANSDPMTYPLMFPLGDLGWTVNIKHDKGDRYVTPLQFYSYRLSYRGTFNPCLSLGKLSQQYIVDVWSKVESERLKYIRQQQKKLRAEMYCGLMDYINNKAKEQNISVGKMIILPSTFIGGPRSYQQCFMDGMRLVQEFGKPDLFITMTCNPKWPEITENLLNGQSVSDRPDIVAKVFHLKVQALMKELKEDQIFGIVIAFIYVVEFQKRGLPHIHLIIFLDKKFAIRDPETVDKIISAEIPDETINPRLFNIVKQFQIHGPCGSQNMNSPCMDPEKKVCTKHYPKAFCSETNYCSKSYPLYRRRNNGRQIILYNKKNNNGPLTIKYIIDNSMVVPYNPYLSLKFNCHINVEVCSSIECIKYLFKYCYKGYDCAVIGFKDSNEDIQYDEIQQYISTRYVCPPEAMHRLLEFNMHEQSHTTCRLAVHLPNQQQIYFKEGLEKEALDKFKNTTLTAWFKLNKENPQARKYLYTEIPNYYRFLETEKVWKIRERFFKPLLSRMFFVSPKDIERYYLRILLLYVRGAQSYEDVKTYNGITYNTFAEAARARNLMIDDNEWDNCLTEAISVKFPKELCRLFAYICVFGLPANAVDLWNKYKEYMVFDNNVPIEIAIQKSLTLINEVLGFHGFTLNQFGLPSVDQNILQNYVSVNDESNILSLKLLKAEAEILIQSLNDDQRQVFDVVIKAINNNDYKNRYIFLDGPGGSGKSYLHNTIITAIESEGLVVLPVAWTGIAANLLKGGRTSHSMFKFPIPLNEDSTCNISGMSKQAELLRNAKIIIWDEITMAPKYALQAMECMLRDITKCNRPFGGKVILLSGDFRQTLPIVKHGSRTHIVETCVKNSALWKLFVTMSLHINIRVDNNQKDFSSWLLKVGDGRTQSTFEKENNVVEIPQKLISNENLIDEIYGLSVNPNDISVYSSCILSLTNLEVLDINERILSRLEGENVVYYSNDSHVDDESKDLNNIVPIEFLNSLTPDGLPPYKLSLKVGCIIMLLRNMNLAQGLCNGTRLVVKDLLRNVIFAEIITGKSKGEKVLIPRIDLSPSQDTFPFKMIRRQFPVRLAYAMTVNKSQGQSFNKVGIFLPNPAFGHGQIYVAFSRVKSEENLKIQAVNSAAFRNSEFPNKLYLKNIVYSEIL